MSVEEAQVRGTGAESREQGQNPEGRLRCGSAPGGGWANESGGLRMMEAMVERSNLWSADQRVVRNGGAAGVDDLPVSALKAWLKAHWPSVKAALLEGSYQPAAVRAVDIPKPSGGKRTLGIPTVLDRLIQQALLQVRQPLVEPTFSESSYGFRPGRNAH